MTTFIKITSAILLLSAACDGGKYKSPQDVPLTANVPAESAQYTLEDGDISAEAVLHFPKSQLAPSDSLHHTTLEIDSPTEEEKDVTSENDFEEHIFTFTGPQHPEPVPVEIKAHQSSKKQKYVVHIKNPAPPTPKIVLPVIQPGGGVKTVIYVENELQQPIVPPILNLLGAGSPDPPEVIFSSFPVDNQHIQITDDNAPEINLDVNEGEHEVTFEGELSAPPNKYRRSSLSHSS